jgi:hypothetical protein
VPPGSTTSPSERRHLCRGGAPRVGDAGPARAVARSARAPKVPGVVREIGAQAQRDDVVDGRGVALALGPADRAVGSRRRTCSRSRRQGRPRRPWLFAVIACAAGARRGVARGCRSGSGAWSGAAPVGTLRSSRHAPFEGSRRGTLGSSGRSYGRARFEVDGPAAVVAGNEAGSLPFGAALIRCG